MKYLIELMAIIVVVAFAFDYLIKKMIYYQDHVSKDEIPLSTLFRWGLVVIIPVIFFIVYYV